MQALSRIALIAGTWLLAAAAPAVTVVECVDAEGNSSFRDTCPPGTVKRGEKHLRGAGASDQPDMDEIAAANPITLYTVPDCDACDLVRNALSGRGIPFTETDVQDDAERQEQMKAVTGDLTVPALVIGERVLSGYSRDAIDGALEQAGYPVVVDGSRSAAAE